MKTLLTTAMALGVVCTLGNNQAAQAWTPQYQDAPAYHQVHIQQARWYGGYHRGWYGSRYHHYAYPGYVTPEYYWGGPSYYYPHCSSCNQPYYAY